MMTIKNLREVKFRLYICKQCKRRRRIYKGAIVTRRNVSFQYMYCSQGHQWEYEIIGAERLVQIMTDVFKDKIMNLFDNDDIFYRKIKNRL
jgi:hypothetical protein